MGTWPIVLYICVPLSQRALQGWLTYYVDYKYGEILPDIKRDGSPGGLWKETSSAKVWDWKNGFHSAEHALVSYIHAQALAGRESRLYFAFPAGQNLPTKPYLFPGRETQRQTLETFSLGGKPHQKVASDLKVELK